MKKQEKINVNLEGKTYLEYLTWFFYWIVFSIGVGWILHGFHLIKR